MKTVVLTGIGQMEMRDVPLPVIKNSTDVLIKMAAIGVCGSDVHYYVSGKIGSQVVEYPFTVGHEGAGTVEEVGSAVKDLKPGDRIAIDPAISCFQCDQCEAGRHHTCRKLRFLGCPGQLEGCLSEYIVMPRESCYKIRDAMTFEQATLSEPLAIGLYAVKKSMPMRKAAIGILGAGPIGLSVLLAARAFGAEKIYMTDKIDERLGFALNAGADWTGNPDTIDIVQSVNELEAAQLDVVFECCGQQDALDQAIELLKPGGELVLIGIPAVDRVSFIIDKMRRKEICIKNIRRQVGCVQATLDMIDDKMIEVDSMVTHRFALEQTQEAFDLVAKYGNGVIKAMIEV